MGYLVVFRYFIMFLLFVTARANRAEVGYGPGFDSCGDSCQTGLRLFCTELRDAAQQKACWCRDVEVYYDHMDSCLSSCSTGYDMRGQRGLLMRYRGVVCGAKDEEFEEYYMDRYGGEFYPNPLRNAPPPPLLLEEKSISKTKTKTQTSMTTKTRTTSKTRSTTTSSSSSSTSAPASTAAPTPTETSDSSDDSGSGSSLPVGAIAGIAAGSASVVIALILAAVIIWHRKKRNSEKSPTATPPLNWPPNLERRVSVYYSPDDVGRTPTTPRAQAGNWQLPHPGQRVPSVATTIMEDSASDYDGSSSSGSRSTWTVIEGAEQDQFYDVDLGVAR